MANPIFDKILEALASLATLEVVTVVGSTTVTTDDDKLNVTVDSKKSKAIKSKINLATGDISTAIDPDFITGPLASMREFHNQQVVNGREVIATNFKALTELGGAIGEQIGKYVTPGD